MARGRHRRVSPYRFLLRYARQDVPGLSAILILTLLATGVTLLTPWPMKVLVDQVLGDEDRTPLTAWLPGGATDGGLLAWVVAATLTVFLLTSGLEVLLTFLWVRVGQGMVFRLQRQVFAKVQRRSVLFHERHDVGDTMERVIGDPWSLHAVVTSLVFSPLQQALLTVGMVALLAGLDPALTGLAVVVTPAMVWIARRRGRPTQRAGEARRRVLGLLQSHLHQSLTGIPVVQAFGQEKRVHARFVELSGAVVTAEWRTTLVSKVTDLLSGSATVLGQGLVLLVGARQVLAGHMSVGSLLVFLAYLTSLQSSLTELTAVYPTLCGARPQIDRVVEVLEAEPEVADGPGVG
ncbi:ABC transporter transmembrane domain-containing protein, partial [Blastococcus deserti]